MDMKVSFLRESLAREQEHEPLFSYPRLAVQDARSLQPPPKESAVVMLITPTAAGISTVLVKRANRGDVHGGQLAFPGGKLEAGETHLEAALREMEEEVGLQANQIELLGQLSPVYIPPSHFVVQPIVAWLPALHNWRIQPNEIDEVLIAPLNQFQYHLREHRSVLRHDGSKFDVIGFPVGSHFLWGATAMMVHEFVQKTFNE